MRNPVVFVFLGEESDLRETIGGIQANEGGFCLNRVNVYVVARSLLAFENWHVESERIRAIFCDEFPSVDMTLVLAFTREFCDAARKFLAVAKKNVAPFERVFIISDKNEFGEILPGAEKRVCEIIAALPLLHDTESRFCDALAGRSDDMPALASAGFWQRPPLLYEGNRELHKLAEVVKNTLENDSFFEGGSGETFFSKKVSPEELIKNTLAITAKPTRFYNLTNRTIKEAENLLFGDIAEKFFKKNYPPEIFAAEKYAEKMSLCDAVVAEKKLRDTIVETEIAIKILENEAALASASIVRPWQTIQRVKVRVGECYALRYELESLRSVHEKFSEEHAALAKILDELRAAVNRIKKLHIAEPPDEISECDMLARAEKLAPVAISLIRDDGLLRENHIVRNTRGESCLLRVVGGFAPCDLQKKF